jgi:hypothetical protein
LSYITCHDIALLNLFNYQEKSFSPPFSTWVSVSVSIVSACILGLPGF